MNRRFRAMALCLALVPSTGVASETMIGRWCDVVLRSANITQTIEFVIVADGALLMRRAFSDGSSDEVPLEELGGEVYAEVDADFGERYRIVGSSGELQLLDDDGLIRTARRLENTPRAGDCR